MFQFIKFMHMNSVYRKALLITSCGMLAALVGFIAGKTVLQRYKSEGVLSVEMTVAEYKRFAEAASNPASLAPVLASTPIASEELLKLEKIVLEAKGGWHTALPRLNKIEAKDIPDNVLKLELDKERDKAVSPRVYVGARLTASSNNPEQAASFAVWLGSYFKEVATREAIREQIFEWLAENRQFSEAAQSQKLRFAFDIEQSEIRALGLKKVLASYPELSKADGKQVVDLRKENEKFISPGSQLIGVETEIIDIREKIARIDRGIVQNTFAKKYLEDAQAALASASTGSVLVKKLSELTVTYSKKVGNEAEQEQLLTLASTISKISSRFLSQAQFVVPPPVPSRAEAPRPLLLSLIFGFFGLVGATVWLFRTRLMAQLFQQAEN